MMRGGRAAPRASKCGNPEAPPYTSPMAQAQAEPPRPATGPDLGRLRIARDAVPARRGRGGRALVVVLLVLAAGGFWAWRQGYVSFSTPGGADVREVAVVRVDGAGGAGGAGGPAPGATAATEVKANGYVIARRRAALSTVLSGRLHSVNVEEGDEVKANDVVARIQFDDYEAAQAAAAKDVAVARARREETAKSLAASRLDLERLRGDNDVLRRLVDQAKSEADRAEREVERNRDLHARKLIDDGVWDRLQSDARSAAAALEAARSRVRAGESAETAWSGEIARREAVLATQDAEIEKALQAERQAAILVEKTYVRAPWDGLVVHKDAEVGEVVASTGFGGNSRGSVATIVDLKTLEVQVELPETRLGRISEGDATRMILDADPSKSWPGRVRQVWPTADRQKATVEMRVEFLERPPILKPEMGVRVEFLPKGTPAEPGVPAAKVTVASRAVVDRGGKSVVFVVSRGVARAVEVRTAKGATPDAVEVVSGLSGGETVVIDPPADLRDGEKVKTVGSP